MTAEVLECACVYNLSACVTLTDWKPVEDGSLFIRGEQEQSVSAAVWAQSYRI